MAIDFGKLRGNGISDILHPREIFSLLSNKDPKFSYLRDVQTEVLNIWFERRQEKDIVVKMNTGSGKTTVGLLILKSCLNEKQGPAVYITPDPYLTKQVMKEAELLGINVTDNVHSFDYLKGDAILVTYIHKIINGNSVFGVNEIKKEIGSFIIDDAHAFLSATENQYRIVIKRDEAQDKGGKGEKKEKSVYTQLFELLKDDLLTQSDLIDIMNNDPQKNVLVPFWAWISKSNKIYEILYKNKDEDGIFWAWPLIKNNLKLCNCVVSGNEIEISPKCLPIDSVPSLINAKRRIFMTATLVDDSILISDFDLNSDSINRPITPKNANDIGDRIILIPQDLNNNLTDDDVKDYLKKLSTKLNVVVIVPSYFRLKFWAQEADLILNSENIYDGVETLKKKHIGLTIIVNKYDGIDLPDKACRVLVIDNLPDVRSKFGKIEQSILYGSEEILLRDLQKIEQGMGRGVRSNNDFCAIFLMGSNLINKLYTKNGISKFTKATYAQWQLSEKLAEQLKDCTFKDITNLLKIFISRDKQWVDASKEALLKIEYPTEGRVRPYILKLREAYNFAQIGRYEKSIGAVQEIVNTMDEKEKTLKGYMKQILAEYTYFKDPVKSQEILISALTYNKQVIKPIEGISYSKLVKKKQQPTECLSFLKQFDDKNYVIFYMNTILDDLNFQPDTASRFEEAFKNLSLLIGFKSQRPEEEYGGKGPDVLWLVGDLNYFIIECKNGCITELISKHDCDQLSGSINWFKSKYDDTCSFVPIMVHPSNKFERHASPHEDVRIITTEKLDDIKQNIKNFVKVAKDKEEIADIKNLLEYYNFTKDKFINKFTVKYIVQ